ncbi:hypothetical protein C0J52_01728 [Blattella germanica]|nr:hypothetical protein C0J52_01728 [Blattella germanica]
MCRLCAKEDPACRPIPVFGEEGKKIRIAKKIGLCLPIIITEEDEYPKQICLSCLNKLDTSYELYSGCIGAQKIIKRMLALIKPTERPREKSPIPEQPVSK